MDQGTLVEMLIDDGKRLIERLVEDGVQVKAASWLKETEGGQWYLYIVTPLVGEDGATRAAYRRLNEVVGRMPQPFWIHPFEIKVIEPDGVMGKALEELHSHYPGRIPIRYGGSQLGGIPIEGAYVYPLAVGASH